MSRPQITFFHSSKKSRGKPGAGLPVLLSCRREKSYLGTSYLPQSLPNPGCKLELTGALSSPASWQRLLLLHSSSRAMASVARQ